MKHLVITGASGGLGSELLAYFITKNFDFLYAVGNKDKLLAKNLSHQKLKYIFDLNLTEESEIKKMFDEITLSQNDELFIIHTVGAYSGGKKFYEYSKEDLLEMFNKNFVSAYIVSKFAVNHIKYSNGGSIVFLSSIIALSYSIGRSIYSISKLALHQLVKIIEAEAKEFNFTANVIAPSIILTETNKKWVKPSDLPNCVRPDEIAEMIESIFSHYQNINGNIYTF